MRRDKVVRNRKGLLGGCRSVLHADILAKAQQKAEWFMSHRAMRRYWDEPNAELYGPLSLTSRWLKSKLSLASNGS